MLYRSNEAAHKEIHGYYKAEYSQLGVPRSQEIDWENTAVSDFVYIRE